MATTITNGIILLGGEGTRLRPQTELLNKHLILLDKRLIVDYSLGTLQNLGCKNVSVIMGGEHPDQVVAYLRDGSQYGMTFNYIYQIKSLGIAHAINLCRRFVQDDTHFAVVLGDNYFEHSIPFNPVYPGSAQIALHKHSDLQRFGVASVKAHRITKIEEKPKALDYTADNYAISGCYLFDQHYFDYYRNIKPSARGEFEIVDVLEQYRQDHALDYVMTKGLWSDMGTHQALAEIQQYLAKKANTDGTTRS